MSDNAYKVRQQQGPSTLERHVASWCHAQVLATRCDVSSSCHGQNTHPTASTFTCPSVMLSVFCTHIKGRGHRGRRRLVRCHPQTGPSSPPLARSCVRRNLLIGPYLFLRPTLSGKCLHSLVIRKPTPSVRAAARLARFFVGSIQLHVPSTSRSERKLRRMKAFTRLLQPYHPQTDSSHPRQHYHPSHAQAPPRAPLAHSQCHFHFQ